MQIYNDKKYIYIYTLLIIQIHISFIDKIHVDTKLQYRNIIQNIFNLRYSNYRNQYLNYIAIKITREHFNRFT